MRRRLFGILGAIIILLGFFGTASASINFSVRQGFEGYVVPGRLIPLHVKIEGLDGEARIDIEELNRDDRRLLVSYPVIASGDQMHMEIPVYVRETGSQYSIRLIRGQDVLSTMTQNTSQRVFPGHLILTHGVLPKVRQGLKATLAPEEPVWVVGIEPPELPTTIPGYDSVSSLILQDPGLVLNPAQLRAMRVWLSGGGRMVIFALRPWKESLLSELVRERPRGAKSLLKVGLGGIVIISGELSGDEIGEGEFWREQLALQPFIQSKRLSITPAFAGVNGRPKTPQSRWPVVIFLTCWAALLGFIRRYCQKAAPWLLLTSVIAIILAFPVGHKVAEEWHRGAEVVSWVVALPEGEGMLFETSVWPRRRGTWRGMMGYQPSPWSINLFHRNIGEGVLQEGRLGDMSWRNAGGAPQQLSLPIKNGLRRTGWIPTKHTTLEAKVQAFLARADAAALWEDGKWKVLRRTKNGSSHWVSSKTLAKELREQSGWIRSMTKFSPESRWLFGYGRIPGFDLYIQQSSAGRGYWAIPIMEGDMP